MSLLDRLLSRVSPEPNTGCWLWGGALQTNGYGSFSLGGGSGKSALAHRVSYELHVGPIPDGLTLDHLCRTRCCVNPSHLEPVTQAENTARGFGPAAVNARKEFCIRGHRLAGENLIVKRSGKRNCRTCARADGRRNYRRLNPDVVRGEYHHAVIADAVTS